MKLRVTVPSKEARKIRDRVLGMVSSTEHEEWDLEWILVRFCVFCTYMCGECAGVLCIVSVGVAWAVCRCVHGECVCGTVYGW